jgi:hypothetical protein
MRTRHRATIEDLRLAIDCLPRRTRTAMLEGIGTNEIIVGAYSNGDGICPMLAAHRAGGRTSLIAFAQAWDRVAFRGGRTTHARRATERELLILRSHLEASLLEDDAPVAELAAARREHLDLVARRQPAPPPGPGSREAERPGDPDRSAEMRQRPGDPDRSSELRQRPGDPDRSAELRHRPGWRWTRIVRRYDEYERILRRLDAELSGSAGDPGTAVPVEAEAPLTR